MKFLNGRQNRLKRVLRDDMGESLALYSQLTIVIICVKTTVAMSSLSHVINLPIGYVKHYLTSFQKHKQSNRGNRIDKSNG